MRVRFLVVPLILVLAAQALAHHSLAMYDSQRPVTITGTITKVEWINPHVWVTLSVKKENGLLASQRIEIAGPNHLKQLGFDKRLLSIGSSVSFEAWLAKDPAYDIGPNGRTVTLSDGRRFDVSDHWPMSRIEPRFK